MQPYSRMDMLRAQALAMRVGQMPQQAPGGLLPQLQNQPVQSMLRPRYMSNMGGLGGRSVRGISGGGY